MKERKKDNIGSAKEIIGRRNVRKKENKKEKVHEKKLDPSEEFIGFHRRTLLISPAIPAGLAHLTWMVCEMGGK